MDIIHKIDTYEICDNMYKSLTNEIKNDLILYTALKDHYDGYTLFTPTLKGTIKLAQGAVRYRYSSFIDFIYEWSPDWFYYI